MSKDYEILKQLIKSRDIENLDNDVIYITLKRLKDLIKESSSIANPDNLIIKNNHVLNCILYGKEIEIINDETIIIGGFSIGVVKND